MGRTKTSRMSRRTTRSRSTISVDQSVSNDPIIKNTRKRLNRTTTQELMLSELEDEDLPESLPDLGPSGNQSIRTDRKIKQSVSMSPTRSSPKERISPRTSGYSSENIKYVKDTIRAPGPSGIAPMPSAGIFKRKNEKKTSREPDTTTSTISSAGNPSGVFVRPSTGLRDRFGLKPSKKKDDVSTKEKVSLEETKSFASSSSRGAIVDGENDRPEIPSIARIVKAIFVMCIKLWRILQSSGIGNVILIIIIFNFYRLYDSKTKIEVTPKSSIYDSAIKLDPQNSQFILFYQAKVDKEIKQMQEELEKLRRQAKEMYSIEMKSCMDMVKSVRSEMEKSFIGQEDQMSKLRTEVGANLNSLNYDISGLLQFKNESADLMKVKVNDWVNDAIYSDEFKTQIEDHVRSLQSTASTQIRSFGRLFDSLKGYMGDTQNFEQTVENLIDTKIEMYHNDRTGLPDYAIDTAGGTIIEYRSTLSMNTGSTLLSVFGFPLISDKNNPTRAIQADNSPGNCWAFDGEVGHLTIKLGQPIFISHVTIEHIPKNLSPSGTIQSAPREVSALALSNVEDQVGYQLGKFVYDISGSSVQMFQIAKQIHFPTQYIQFRFQSNWGGGYTCIYRLRVHGSVNS